MYARSLSFYCPFWIQYLRPDSIGTAVSSAMLFMCHPREDGDPGPSSDWMPACYVKMNLRGMCEHDMLQLIPRQSYSV